MLKSRTTLRLSSRLVQNEATLNAIWRPLGLDNASSATLRDGVLRVIRAAYNPILREHLELGLDATTMFRRRGTPERFQEAVLLRIGNLPEQFQEITSRQEDILGEVLYDILRFYRFTDGDHWLQTDDEKGDEEKGDEEKGDEEKGDEESDEEESDKEESDEKGDKEESDEEESDKEESDKEESDKEESDKEESDKEESDEEEESGEEGDEGDDLKIQVEMDIDPKGGNGEGSPSGHKRKFDWEEEDEPSKKRAVQ
ncbi:uncharacterized protein N7515_001648 [Penicillium bovifimosum]|uniref:Uncharacterized protein n=1 Tax=Penicillium bovifimosum TaxID=126998 RepID=A0A9W9L8K3_9EURO|nr:uncharacterized protein N7515_001648 [Penicillium bovifimosum]KAJ5142861.1 hypothetical protein N7515_001648 [Penicillium bovifimosum]